MNDKVLVFIPAYNCEKQITRVLSQFDSEMLNYVANIIVINNRSTDATEKAVLMFMEEHREIPIVLLRNEENYGLGGSHKVAFSYAIENKFDFLIVLHGDDQGNIKDFIPLLKSGNYRKYDCCLGARFMKESRLIGYSKLRIWGNKGFNILFSLVVRRKIYDLGSGLNLYKVETLKRRYYERYPDTLYFNDCMILASCHYKHKMLFYPISWREEDQVSNNKILKFAMSLLVMLGEYCINKGKYLNSDMRKKEIIDYKARCIDFIHE